VKIDLTLKNVTLPDGIVKDLTISNGLVEHSGAANVRENIIDCRGLIVIPAALDMHVHMRGFEQEYKEDWKSGSESAVAGGVTLVVDQPNTIPPLECPDLFKKRVGEALENSVCDFSINGAGTEGSDISGLWSTGALAFGEIFVASSSYGSALSHESIREILGKIKNNGALATIHAETINSTPAVGLVNHNLSRPGPGETDAVRMVEQLNVNDCRLHYCHLSTKESVLAANGSTEVTPHHLFFSLEMFKDTDPVAKVNPPIRTEKERKALFSIWDRIDVIASDHAPHTREEKSLKFEEAPSGIAGVETLLPLLMNAVLEKKISLNSVIDKTSKNPRKILDIPRNGFNKGEIADFAIFPKIQKRIMSDEMHTKAKFSAFEGKNAVFPDIVIKNGDIIYNKGEFFTSTPKWYHGRGYIQ